MIDAGDITDSTILRPNRGPTPSATSTSTLSIDATWAAGTVPTGAPAINGYQFSWRQEGEPWSLSETLGSNARSHTFAVPDASLAIEMEVRAGNVNGYGQWSDTGRIDAADIFNPSTLTPNMGPTPSATSTAALVIDATWAAGTAPTGAPAITGLPIPMAAGGRELVDGPHRHPDRRAGNVVHGAGRRLGRADASAGRQLERLRRLVGAVRHHRLGRHRHRSAVADAAIRLDGRSLRHLGMAQRDAGTGHRARRCWRWRGGWCDGRARARTRYSLSGVHTRV